MRGQLQVEDGHDCSDSRIKLRNCTPPARSGIIIPQSSRIPHMPFESIIWDLDDDPDGNVEHCAEHGVTKEEVEKSFKMRPTPTSAGRPAVPLFLGTPMGADT